MQKTSLNCKINQVVLHQTNRHSIKYVGQKPIKKKEEGKKMSRHEIFKQQDENKL